MSGIVAALRRLGVNRPAFYSIMTRGTQSVTALVTIGFVGRFLTLEGQGYYYTILSFVAFVLLGEFGLSYAVMQSASHETAGVIPSESVIPSERSESRDRDRPDRGLSGDVTASRLRALLSGATRFNAWTTTLALVTVIAVG